MQAKQVLWKKKIIFRICSWNSVKNYISAYTNQLSNSLFKLSKANKNNFHTKIVKNNKAVARTVKSPLTQACISLKYIRITSSQKCHTFLLLIWALVIKAEPKPAFLIWYYRSAFLGASNSPLYTDQNINDTLKHLVWLGFITISYAPLDFVNSCNVMVCSSKTGVFMLIYDVSSSRAWRKCVTPLKTKSSVKLQASVHSNTILQQKRWKKNILPLCHNLNFILWFPVRIYSNSYRIN